MPSEEGQCKLENKNAQLNLKKGYIIKLGQKIYQIVEKNIIGKKEEETNNYLDNIFSEQVDNNKIIMTHEDKVNKDIKDDKDKKEKKYNKENKEKNENKDNKKK